MMRLWESGPQRQADLAAEFGTDSARMTRTVQRLERAGYVRRVPDPDDGRATRVEPTPASLVLRAQVEEIWTRLEQLTVGDLTPAQRTAALRTLRRLEDNLLDQ
ncbi:MAG: MarR family transcriptional regulator [Actinomycetia bacterium]|nr:MarR family transcriptional regulator [Actinomycetes bacterium]